MIFTFDIENNHDIVCLKQFRFMSYICITSRSYIKLPEASLEFHLLFRKINLTISFTKEDAHTQTAVFGKINLTKNMFRLSRFNIKRAKTVR